MRLRNSIETYGGERLDVYHGTIRRYEIEQDDELYWRIGSRVGSYILKGIVDLVEEDEIYLETNVESALLQSTYIGRHKLKNKHRGEKDSLQGSRPFSMGVIFKENVRAQIGDISGELIDALDSIARRRTSPESPWLVRRS